MAEGYSFEEDAKQWQLLKFGYSDRPLGKGHVKTAVLKPTLRLATRDNSRLVALLALLKGQADIDRPAESDSRPYAHRLIPPEGNVVGRQVFSSPEVGRIREPELKSQAGRPLCET